MMTTSQTSAHWGFASIKVSSRKFWESFLKRIVKVTKDFLLILGFFYLLLLTFWNKMIEKVKQTWIATFLPPQFFHLTFKYSVCRMFHDFFSPNNHNLCPATKKTVNRSVELNFNDVFRKTFTQWIFWNNFQFSLVHTIFRFIDSQNLMRKTSK